MAIQFKPHNGLPRWCTALIEVFLCSGVPTQFSLGIILVIIGWPSTNPDGSLSLIYICTLALTDMALLIGLMIWLMHLHDESLSKLWLGSRPIMTEIFLGLSWIPLLLIAVATLLYIIRTITPELHNVIENPLEQLLHTTGGAIAFGFIAILAGGVREELQRAFLLNRFEQHLGGPVIGVVLISIGFGLGHLVQGWDAVLTTGTMGLFWAVVYLRRRSSVSPIVSHAGFNALGIIRSVLMSQ
jgi:membrane protease YdiL (CAAX protease family)